MSVPPDSTPPPYASSAVPPADPFVPSAQERQWAMFAHLSALLGALLTSAWGGGWACFVGPLVIWLIKRDQMPFVNEQAREALNFNITVAIVVAALWVLTLMTFGLGLILALPLWFIVGIVWLVLTLVATIKANQGKHYRYPMTLRLVS